MADKSQKTESVKVEIKEEMEKHQEIAQALEAMQRIIAVEDVKARNLLESPPRYVHIR